MVTSSWDRASRVSEIVFSINEDPICDEDATDFSYIFMYNGIIVKIGHCEQGVINNTKKLLEGYDYFEMLYIKDDVQDDDLQLIRDTFRFLELSDKRIYTF
jgi:hypothetical protein